MESFDICKEIGNTAWIDSFQIQLKSTTRIFHENLKGFSNDSTTLRKRQAPIRQIRQNLKSTDSESIKEINCLFKDCKELEAKLEEFETAPKEWEKEGKSQILFTHDFTKPLNHIPFLLVVAAIFKIYIFPFFAVAMPLLAWILPYVIVRFFFGMQMPFEFYTKTLLNMWMGGKSWETLDFWGQIRVVFQSAWTAFGIFQGMYQPIQQAIHTKTIDDTIVKHGMLVQTFTRKATRVLELLGKIRGKSVNSPFLAEIPLDEPRQTYAFIRDNPTDMKWIWRKLGEEELLWRMACAEGLEFATFRKGGVGLQIQNFYDPSIPMDICVRSSLSLGKGRPHAILTGPNKGGKSSTLRALCLNIWFAQTFGLVFAESATFTPFSWIRSGLRLADLPGSESLFEREIKFAKETLNKSATGKPGIIFYDECFHSTNPPDGEKTAKIFLSHLWSSPNTISLVSTHVFSLLDTAPDRIYRLCVPAEKKDTGIEYSYKLSPGICKVSSVEEIYKKFRFPSAVKMASESGHS